VCFPSPWPSASLSDPGLWPCWSNPLSQAHRTGPVMLLLNLVILWFRFSDAMLDSVNCDSANHVMLCQFLCSLCQHTYCQRCCFWILHTCKIQLALGIC
jgi:hypothetical protein